VSEIKIFVIILSKRKEGNFLDYVKEFDQYEEPIDEDLITPNNGSETTENQNNVDGSLKE
jgi:hypothetical protein